MAQQSDWTTPLPEEPKSYPGTLRGYRDFKDTKSWSAPDLKPNLLVAVSASYEYPAISETEWWESYCTKGEDHKGASTPSAECKCGFYINYFNEDTFYSETNIPRGVVEASGKIVLSRKGFRAQKMRLVALCTPYVNLWKYMEEKMPHVKLFQFKEEMYEAYPQDDLTSLIGTEESRFPKLTSTSALNPNHWIDVGTTNNFSFGGMDFSNSMVSVGAAAKNAMFSIQDLNNAWYNPSYVNYTPPPPSFTTVAVRGGGWLVIDEANKSIGFQHDNKSKPSEIIQFDNITFQHFVDTKGGSLVSIKAFSRRIDLFIDVKEGTYTITAKS